MAETNTQTSAEKAIDKVRDEMAAKPKHSGVQAVGAMLTQMLELGFEGLDAAILAKDKDVEGAFGALRKYASEHKEGNFFYADSSIAMKVIVNGYFGADGVNVVPVMTLADVAKKPKVSAAAVPADDLFSL